MTRTEQTDNDATIPAQDDFEAALKQQLDSFSLAVTPAERQRLDQARRAAVTRVSELHTAGGPRWLRAIDRRWQLGTSVAAVALLAAVLLPGQQVGDIDALPLLDDTGYAAAVDLELLEELELLAWLDEQDLADAG